MFVPWEDVFIYRDPARVLNFFLRSGFMLGFQFQGCTRFAVKLDFIAGLLAKALRCTGGDEARGNQVLLGEAIAWRNLFWSLSNAMANDPDPWVGDAVLPNLRAGLAYRVFAPDAYPRMKDIVERTVTSALIYLPSSVKDFSNPAIEPYLRQYVRGSHGIEYKERIKIMKLLWDAVGTEFGGRHELYERNYAGGWEDIRAQTLTGANAAATSRRWRRWSISAWRTTTRMGGLATTGSVLPEIPGRRGTRDFTGIFHCVRFLCHCERAKQSHRVMHCDGDCRVHFAPRNDRKTPSPTCGRCDPVATAPR